MSHCEGEAKTHIRPTDPALTRVHCSELPGLQRFQGGRWLQVHLGRQPKERHPGAKPRAGHCSWSWSPITQPRATLWCQGTREEPWPPKALSFYSRLVLTHHSHSVPCTHLFNLDTSAWTALSRWREGLEVASLVCRVNFFHQDLLMAVVESWDDREG